MLTPSQVIPLLLHEDEEVRDHAARYLTEAHESSPATAEDIWASIDRFGFGEAGAPCAAGRYLADLPQTESSLRRTLDLLSSPSRDYQRQQSLAVLVNLDFELLSRHRDEVLSAAAGKASVRRHLAARLELADASAEDLWDRLLAYTEELEDSEDPDFDDDLRDRLIEALARHPDFAAAKAMDVLAAPNERWWLEIDCAELLGKPRHRPAVDPLIGRLGDAGDYLTEIAVTSLAAIRDSGVIGRIEHRFADEPWDFQLYASDVLGRYKLPESEAALLRLFDKVREPETQVPVALALCNLFSREGMPACLAASRYTTGIETNDLRIATLAVARAIGYELSAAEQEILGTRFSLSPKLTRLLRRREDSTEWDDEDYVDSTPVRVDQLASRGSADDWQSVTRPIVRETPKVGRNDPCPCGSGKKYKKCCGK